jgi:hypothetical protein
MEKDEPREMELEQELESLYHKVASLAPVEDKQEQNKELRGQTKAPDELKLQYPSEESVSQEKEKRKFRLSRVVPALGVFTFIIVLIAVFFWRTIYHYDSINSGGKIYPLRINSLTGDIAYFNGTEWLRPPIPAGVTKEIPATPNNQSAMVQPAGEKTLKDKAGDLPILSSSKTSNDRKYAVQIKAYPEAEKKDALAFVEELRKSRSDIHVDRVQMPGRGVWYRILLGHFASAEETSNYIKEKQIVNAHPGSFTQQKSEEQ